MKIVIALFGTERMVVQIYSILQCLPEPHPNSYALYLYSNDSQMCAALSSPNASNLWVCTVHCAGVPREGGERSQVEANGQGLRYWRR